uniref:Envelope protein n=1 Tax=Sphaeramia orbicularis TaxID=375764 RepID=A0A672ZPW3_9TELE
MSNPFFIPQLCFHSPVTEHTRYNLGHTSGCNITLKVACGLANCENRTDKYTFPTTGTLSPSPFIIVYNLTALLGKSPLIRYDSKTNVTTTYNDVLALTPSDYGYVCPTDMVWTCGQHSYLYLPAKWAGTCHLSYLVPAISKLTISPVMSPPHTRVKRDRISGGHKFAISIIPMYGPARLSWYIEELSVELENLTASVERGFDALTSEMKALRTVTLQNRAALDLLLAEKGGVCHLIGDQCCTYVPDVTANMSDVHNQLDHLRRVLHEENTAYTTTGWDFWGWLMSGGWKTMLMKIVAMIFGVFVLLLVLSCCIIPIIRLKQLKTII